LKTGTKSKVGSISWPISANSMFFWDSTNFFKLSSDVLSNFKFSIANLFNWIWFSGISGKPLKNEPFSFLYHINGIV
jgi:hypothetical protein